jgi:fermentation-respiration switch protein FrsA (DUF1100 family)
MNWARIVIVGLFVVAGIAGAASYFVPRWFEAAWFLEDIAAGPDKSTWKTLHKTPKREEVSFGIAGREVTGTLYTPDGERVRGRVIFLPGLFPDVTRDPRAVAFAETLARAGWATLVPELPAYRDLRASPADIEAIAAAIDYAAQDGTIGLVTLSYMSGPAILAAARAETAPQVKFVFSIGGYFSIEDTVRFVTTRKFRLGQDGPWQTAPEVPYATWAFLRANAEGIDDAADRARIVRIAEGRVAETLGGPKPDDAADVAALGPEGRAVFDLVANRDAEKVAPLIAALPPRIRTAMDALDLSKADLSKLSAEVLLAHGADDPLIPPTESEKLAAALGSRATLYLLPTVGHVEINKGGGFWDQLRIARAAYRLLAYRE